MLVWLSVLIAAWLVFNLVFVLLLLNRRRVRPTGAMTIHPDLIAL